MAEIGNLSQREIWDDSILQDSWNEALEEYNHYHSIHARGEKVHEVLKKFEGGNGVVNENTENAGNENILDGHGEGEVEVKGKGPEVVEAPAGPSNTQKNRDDSTSKVSSPPGMPLLPENLIGSVNDEDLKKLLMSWYYSGYYTGFYEGKQAAARQTNST